MTSGSSRFLTLLLVFFSPVARCRFAAIWGAVYQVYVHVCVCRRIIHVHVCDEHMWEKGWGSEIKCSHCASYGVSRPVSPFDLFLFNIFFLFSFTYFSLCSFFKYETTVSALKIEKLFPLTKSYLYMMKFNSPCLVPPPPTLTPPLLPLLSTGGGWVWRWGWVRVRGGNVHTPTHTSNRHTEKGAWSPSILDWRVMDRHLHAYKRRYTHSHTQAQYVQGQGSNTIICAKVSSTWPRGLWAPKPIRLYTNTHHRTNATQTHMRHTWGQIKIKLFFFFSCWKLLAFAAGIKAVHLEILYCCFPLIM